MTFINGYCGHLPLQFPNRLSKLSAFPDISQRLNLSLSGPKPGSEIVRLLFFRLFTNGRLTLWLDRPLVNESLVGMPHVLQRHRCLQRWPEPEHLAFD